VALLTAPLVAVLVIGPAGPLAMRQGTGVSITDSSLVASGRESGAA
jgi:hypothetical protein